jgi:hypothetical protein
MSLVPGIGDPFGGVIEWGTAGAVAWFALAAAAGIGLRALAAWSRRGATGQATRDRRAERPVPEAA